jgi:hypothetical protein
MKLFESSPPEEWIDEVTDLVGRQLENLTALFLKLQPGEPPHFGVGHKLKMDGQNYRYYYILAKEGTPQYQEIEKVHQKAQSNSGEGEDE